MCTANADVRFTPNCDRESGLLKKVVSALPPKADIRQCKTNVRYGAVSGLMQCSKQNPLFDHFVREREQLSWHVDTERSSRLQINDKFKFVRLQHR